MAKAKTKEIVATNDFQVDLNKLRRELKDSIINLDESFEFFLTGNPIFDAFIGSGGIPKYQMLYEWGTNSIGKSTFALQLLASYQIQHGSNCIAIYFDREESLTTARLKKLKVDHKRVLILNPDYIEQIEERVSKIHADYAQHKIDIFVIWDTIAQTPSKEETEGYSKIGSQARALADIFRKLEFYDLNLTMVALNQHRETIGDKYATKEPPNGNAAKHKSFVTINGVSKKSDIWPDGTNIGRATTLNTVKSKVISPHRKLVFEFTYVYGYDAILTAIRYMWKDMKVLIKKKGGFAFEDAPDVMYSLKKLYRFFLTDESVPRWKQVIDGIYANLYGHDDINFIQEAKERIFSYYFPEGKLNLAGFTSVNIEVVSNSHHGIGGDLNISDNDDDDDFDIIENNDSEPEFDGATNEEY